MNKQEIIKTDMIKAMKDRNKQRKDVLSYLLGQIKNVSIEKRRDLTDDEVNEVTKKGILYIHVLLLMRLILEKNIFIVRYNYGKGSNCSGYS